MSTRKLSNKEVEEIIHRIKQRTDFRSEASIAETIWKSRENFNIRKKKGTLTTDEFKEFCARFALDPRVILAGMDETIVPEFSELEHRIRRLELLLENKDVPPEDEADLLILYREAKAIHEFFGIAVINAMKDYISIRRGEYERKAKETSKTNNMGGLHSRRNAK